MPRFANAVARTALVGALVLAAGAPALAQADARPARAEGGARRPPRIAFFGLHGGMFERFREASRGLEVEVVSADGRLEGKDALPATEVDVLAIQHLRLADVPALREWVRAADRDGAGPVLLSISGLAEAQVSDWADSGRLAFDEVLARDYADGSSDALRHFLRRVLAAHLGIGNPPPPRSPEPGPALFHPDHPEGFTDASSALAWVAKRWPDRPVVAVTAHHLHRIAQQPAVARELVRALEAHGLAAVVVEDNHPDGPQALRALAPDAVVHTCHSFDDVAYRLALGVPHLHSVFTRRPALPGWREGRQGLGAADIAFQITSQEPLGAIEPIVGAAVRSEGDTGEFVPVPERLERIAARTAAWVRLRRTPPAEKRVAIVYYDREMGAAELMRGSATGMFLNAPRSVTALLRRMRDEGYELRDLPRDADELLARMVDHGRNLPADATGELDRIARSGAAALWPVEAYEAWLAEHTTAEMRRELEARFGPPPGRIRVWTADDGRRYFVIPRIDLGNVVLLPQPLRGEAHDSRLAHDKLVPPPHHYLATYAWISQAFGADALIHFGTHGTEFLLPGRGVGLGPEDWSDVVIGALPNLTLWAINNLGESSPARRRAYAVLIDHLVPPSLPARLSDELLSLQEEVRKWSTLEPGPLRERFADSIGEAIRREGLAAELDLPGGDADRPSPEAIERLGEYLMEIAEQPRPTSLHVLGEPPPAETRIPYVLRCMGRTFVEHVAAAAPSEGDPEALARRLLEAVLAGEAAPADAPARFGLASSGEATDALVADLEAARRLHEGLLAAPREIEAVIEALAGRFVAPGPGNPPDRNPAVVPTGRNMYVLNPAEIPTRPSWEIGVRLVDELLEGWRREHGKLPRRVGFTLNSFSTFQDYGVMEAEILYLLGVRPIWDRRNRVVDLELIPREELGRPRVDVFLAALSYYRDMLPSRMKLLDEAVRLAVAAEEPDNGVRAGYAAVRAELERRGVGPERADLLARARLYGYPPGQMGSPGYYYLVERSGDWDTTEQLMETYIQQASHVYTEGAWGEEARAAYEATLRDTEVVLRSWSDSTRSPLSNKYMWYIGGSLCRAIEHLSGRAPSFLLCDLRDPDRASLVEAEHALRRDFRARLLDRAWLRGMMDEGYAGADQLAVHTSNAMGWSIMRSGSVPDELWTQIYEVLVRDRYALGLHEWMNRVNPYAEQEVLEILLESVRKGYWRAPAEAVADLARRLHESVAAHGAAGGLLGHGNAGLEAFIEAALAEGPGAGASGAEPGSPVAGAPAPRGEDAAPGVSEAPAGKAREEVAATEHPVEPPAESSAEFVRGRVLESGPAEPRADGTDEARRTRATVVGALVATLAILGAGYAYGLRSARRYRA